MNNSLKIFCFIIGCAIALPAFGADVTNRTKCTDIQAQINELSALESPTDEQSAQLTALQAQYRSDCARAASGRGQRAGASSAAARASIAATSNVAPAATASTGGTVVVTIKSVLNEYLDKRQDLCDELKSDMDLLVTNGASDTEIEPLQNQYDADCEEIDHSASVVIDAETAARNVSSGLCEDGSKPNKFGCCEGETFTDMGNLVFACCPDDGGTCYPPINNGNAL